MKASDPHSYQGRVVDNGHCVRYVQLAAGAPHTSTWRKGQQVKGNTIPPGTVIATFGPDGRYANSTKGDSHAAIFLSQSDLGIDVMDQWVGKPVGWRRIRFKGGQGLPVDDADAYHVVEVV